MLSTIALCLLAPAGDEWTHLPLPSLCAPVPLAAHPAPAWDARHLRLTGEKTATERILPAARLPATLVTQMLEEDARSRGTQLEFFRATSQLLARGDAAALAAARALLADLDRAGETMEIDLLFALSCGKSSGKSDEGLSAASWSGTSRVRSGGEAFFGSRETQGFISGYDVEVAADSGVAQPILGSASSGTGVHVRAARVDGGRRIHLTGLLDLAELVEVSRFDPDTPDLGIIEEPHVKCAQALFAGVVDSGGKLEVQISGTALSQPDWKLTISATTRADLAPEAKDMQGWAVLDLAFLATEASNPPALDPGAGVSRAGAFTEIPSPQAALPPSALAAALETGRSPGASTSRGATRLPLYWTSDLLCVPRAEPALLREALQLVHGAESVRLSTGRIDVQHGGLRASLPVCEGASSRLVAGSERAWLIDYRAELAPQTWMPAPDVETTFDGVCVEAQPFGSSAACSYWVASSDKPVEVAHKDAQLGKLQILKRSLRADSARLIANQPERAVLTFQAPDREAGTLKLAYKTP